jgi:hypothetical protein
MQRPPPGLSHAEYMPSGDNNQKEKEETKLVCVFFFHLLPSATCATTMAEASDPTDEEGMMTDKKRHRCSECGKAFATPSALTSAHALAHGRPAVPLPALPVRGDNGKRLEDAHPHAHGRAAVPVPALPVCGDTGKQLADAHPHAHGRAAVPVPALPVCGN